MDLNTFSIVGRVPSEGSFGVAVSTARPNVGSLVPFVSLNGAIATQARVNTDLDRQGLALLGAGVGISIALEALLAADEDRDIRQVHAADAHDQFAFTGQGNVPWAGHLVGVDYSVAGNMLTDPDVLAAMAAAFEAATAEGVELSERLMWALEAGQQVGGDKRGKQSAALLVASPDPRLYHNLRVDDHVDPVGELRRVYDVVVAHAGQIVQEYGIEGLRRFSRIRF